MGLAVLGKRECTGNYRRHQFEEESSMEEYLLNKTKDTCDCVEKWSTAIFALLLLVFDELLRVTGSEVKVGLVDIL